MLIHQHEARPEEFHDALGRIEEHLLHLVEEVGGMRVRTNSAALDAGTEAFSPDLSGTPQTLEALLSSWNALADERRVLPDPEQIATLDASMDSILEDLKVVLPVLYAEEGSHRVVNGVATVNDLLRSLELLQRGVLRIRGLDPDTLPAHVADLAHDSVRSGALTSLRTLQKTRAIFGDRDPVPHVPVEEPSADRDLPVRPFQGSVEPVEPAVIAERLSDTREQVLFLSSRLDHRIRGVLNKKLEAYEEAHRELARYDTEAGTLTKLKEVDRTIEESHERTLVIMDRITTRLQEVDAFTEYCEGNHSLPDSDEAERQETSSCVEVSPELLTQHAERLPPEIWTPMRQLIERVWRIVDLDPNSNVSGSRDIEAIANSLILGISEDVAGLDLILTDTVNSLRDLRDEIPPVSRPDNLGRVVERKLRMEGETVLEDLSALTGSERRSLAEEIFRLRTPQVRTPGSSDFRNEGGFATDETIEEIEEFLGLPGARLVTYREGDAICGYAMAFFDSQHFPGYGPQIVKDLEHIGRFGYFKELMLDGSVKGGHAASQLVRTMERAAVGHVDVLAGDLYTQNDKASRYYFTDNPLWYRIDTFVPKAPGGDEDGIAAPYVHIGRVINPLWRKRVLEWAERNDVTGAAPLPQYRGAPELEPLRDCLQELHETLFVDPQPVTTTTTRTITKPWPTPVISLSTGEVEEATRSTEWCTPIAFNSDREGLDEQIAELSERLDNTRDLFYQTRSALSEGFFGASGTIDPYPRLAGSAITRMNLQRFEDCIDVLSDNLAALKEHAESGTDQVPPEMIRAVNNSYQESMVQLQMFSHGVRSSLLHPTPNESILMPASNNLTRSIRSLRRTILTEVQAELDRIDPEFLLVESTPEERQAIAERICSTGSGKIDLSEESEILEAFIPKRVIERIKRLNQVLDTIELLGQNGFQMSSQDLYSDREVVPREAFTPVTREAAEVALSFQFHGNQLEFQSSTADEEAHAWLISNSEEIARGGRKSLTTRFFESVFRDQDEFDQEAYFAELEGVEIEVRIPRRADGEAPDSYISIAGVRTESSDAAFQIITDVLRECVIRGVLHSNGQLNSELVVDLIPREYNSNDAESVAALHDMRTRLPLWLVDSRTPGDRRTQAMFELVTGRWRGDYAPSLRFVDSLPETERDTTSVVEIATPNAPAPSPNLTLHQLDAVQRHRRVRRISAQLEDGESLALSDVFAVSGRERAYVEGTGEVRNLSRIVLTRDGIFAEDLQLQPGASEPIAEPALRVLAGRDLHAACISGDAILGRLLAHTKQLNRRLDEPISEKAIELEEIEPSSEPAREGRAVRKLQGFTRKQQSYDLMFDRCMGYPSHWSDLFGQVEKSFLTLNRREILDGTLFGTFEEGAARMSGIANQPLMHEFYKEAEGIVETLRELAKIIPGLHRYAPSRIRYGIQGGQPTRKDFRELSGSDREYYVAELALRSDPGEEGGIRRALESPQGGLYILNPDPGHGSGLSSRQDFDSTAILVSDPRSLRSADISIPSQDAASTLNALAAGDRGQSLAYLQRFTAQEGGADPLLRSILIDLVGSKTDVLYY